VLETELDLPWAGILFHPRATGAHRWPPPEHFFRCRNARGALFLVPEKVSIYNRLLPDRKFVMVPDVSEEAKLPQESELVRELRRRAAGRTVVLQAGSLGAHKGTLQLVETIRRADPRRFFFAIVGEVYWGSFGGKAEALRRFIADPPEHCLVRTGYLEDERELNSIIAASDILFAVYRGFGGSSNTLTKASIYAKPVLVSDSSLMGERVRRYGIGATVASDDPASILAALEALRDRPRSRLEFAAYRRDHSTEALKEALADALASWRQPSGAGA
jgi:glycosyltransferase involved in cell wall biosynthesis